ncbi:hypothetical protein PTTG_01947, partial [Puccinia triticina 1-1 BBBD Race 1]
MPTPADTEDTTITNPPKVNEDHETPPHLPRNRTAQTNNPPMPDFANSPYGYYPPFPYMHYPYPYHSLPSNFPQHPSPTTPSPNNPFPTTHPQAQPPPPPTQTRQDVLDRAIDDTRNRQ